jgi:murein DD-endopeptidase
MLKPRISGIAAVVLLAALGQGCAGTAPPRSSYPEGGDGPSVVAAARDVIGAPYRYGGFTPGGFDCSGLVYYAHRQAGIPVPRTTQAQLRDARRVGIGDLRPGDVLFFELQGKKVSHVGIYAGAGNFIHAPSTGKRVSYARLQSKFWRSRLLGAGRFD